MIINQEYQQAFADNLATLEAGFLEQTKAGAQYMRQELGRGAVLLTLNAGMTAWRAYRGTDGVYNSAQAMVSATSEPYAQITLYHARYEGSGQSYQFGQVRHALWVPSERSAREPKIFSSVDFEAGVLQDGRREVAETMQIDFTEKQPIRPIQPVAFIQSCVKSMLEELASE